MRVLNVFETAMGGVGIYQNQLNEMSNPGLEHCFLAPDQHREFLNADLPVSTFDRPRRGLRAIGGLLRQFLRQKRQRRPDLRLHLIGGAVRKVRQKCRAMSIT